MGTTFVAPDTSTLAHCPTYHSQGETGAPLEMALGASIAGRCAQSGQPIRLAHA